MVIDVLTLSSGIPLNRVSMSSREEIETPTVTWKALNERVGYIHISLFGEKSKEELLQALEERNAITPDPTRPGYLRISTHQIRKAADNEVSKRQYEELWERARKEDGARLIGGAKYIRIRQPVTEANDN